MEFDGFDWDDGNLEKCLKHGVTIAEIEFVLRTAELVSEDSAHSISEQRLIAVGASREGRMMFVAFTLRQAGEDVLVRPVSARYMHQKEFRRYAQEKGD